MLGFCFVLFSVVPGLQRGKVWSFCAFSKSFDHLDQASAPTEEIFPANITRENSTNQVNGQQIGEPLWGRQNITALIRDTEEEVHKVGCSEYIVGGCWGLSLRLPTGITLSNPFRLSTISKRFYLG